MESNWKEFDAAFAWGFCSQYPNEAIMLDLLSCEHPPVKIPQSALEMIRLLTVQCGTYVDMCSVISQKLNELALLNRHLYQQEGQSEPPQFFPVSDPSSYDELPFDAHGEAPPHSGPVGRLSRAIEMGFESSSLNYLRPLFRLGRLLGAFLALHWVDRETGMCEHADEVWCNAIENQVSHLPDDLQPAVEVLVDVSKACRSTEVPHALRECLEDECDADEAITPYALLKFLCDELREVELSNDDRSKVTPLARSERVELFNYSDKTQCLIDGNPIEKRLSPVPYTVVEFLVRNYPRAFTLQELCRELGRDVRSAITRLRQINEWEEVLKTPSMSKNSTYSID
ncbi:hypothetical protein DTL21_00075 [Bremerella cremea]|uniref:Uncharacterized protein n=1 Tax=Blastopirellula marina TaxID=124 RepID=A0A2S8G8C2_9BACT|nr:hypothetical protein C5Y83_00075 [Blastopirellula marina]RCS51956.1 hypothetical protein DTL21_00075 [Bremerella cremea]